MGMRRSAKCSHRVGNELCKEEGEGKGRHTGNSPGSPERHTRLHSGGPARRSLGKEGHPFAQMQDSQIAQNPHQASAEDSPALKLARGAM
jgi:hypothetical protein